MNPNPDLILNPPLNPLLGTLVSNLPDLPINNLSFQSLLSATGNHVMHPQFSALNPWDDQLFANYPPNQMINHPCMSTTSPNYSANYSGNYSAASVNSPPNYAANYATNHSNSNMMSQHNHEYEQLINLCTSSTSVNHNANHSNVGFNYVPNYDNLIASHEELVIKDHMKESLSRANSSSLITLPKPVNNPEILCNSDIINHAALIASRPNDIIRPNLAIQNPKSRKKRIRSEAASSDSLKGDNPAAVADPEQEDQSMEDTNRRQQKSKRAKSAEAKAIISRDAVAMAAAVVELSGYGGGLGLANPNNDRSAACSTITANSWGDSEKPSIVGENREMKAAAAAGGSGSSEEGDSDRPDKTALLAKNSFKIKAGPADPDPAEPPNSDKSAQKSAVEEPAAAPAPAPPAQLDYIHVRARRGQATDSHSLAERVRREKIGERMKYLQDLVPGCSKVTGKAMMLDEIINYVQSLQRQVEFLSMKLASVHPNKVESLFQEVIQPVNHVQAAGQQVPIRSLYGNSFHSTEMSRMPLQPDQPVNQVINANATPTLSDHTFGSECISQINGPWEDVDIHNIMQMGFAQNPVLLNSGLYHGQLKKEL